MSTLFVWQKYVVYVTDGKLSGGMKTIEKLFFFFSIFWIFNYTGQDRDPKQYTLNLKIPQFDVLFILSKVNDLTFFIYSLLFHLIHKFQFGK